MRFNKSRSLIATSGVEKVIKLWSVLPINNTDEADDDTEDKDDTGRDISITAHEHIFKSSNQSRIKSIRKGRLDFSLKWSSLVCLQLGSEKEDVIEDVKKLYFPF